MGETAEERQRRLATNMTINSWCGNLGGDDWEVVRNWLLTNPCEEILMTSSQRLALGTNPLVKFNKFKFKFSDEV